MQASVGSLACGEWVLAVVLARAWAFGEAANLGTPGADAMWSNTLTEKSRTRGVR